MYNGLSWKILIKPRKLYEMDNRSLLKGNAVEPYFARPPRSQSFSFEFTQPFNGVAREFVCTIKDPSCVRSNVLLRHFFARLYPENMSTSDEPAEPVAKGLLSTAKQSFGDLFIWKQRVEVTEEGNTYWEWQSPAPLENPFRLFAQLSARDWLFFIVGFLAWTADGASTIMNV